MGIDCYVYTSKCTKEEIDTEIWYGKETLEIMKLLLKGYLGDANCELVLIDKDRIDGFKELFKREVILPNLFDEYELYCFKELLDALENVEESDYIYFYAWY